MPSYWNYYCWSAEKRGELVLYPCLAYAERVRAGQMLFLSSPLLKPPYKHLKQPLHSGNSLEKTRASLEKQWKIAKFSNRMKEITISSNRTQWGMTLKLETRPDAHKKERRIIQKRGCTSLHFSIMPINLITNSSGVCVLTRTDNVLM